jgi:hypothetical protein
VGSQISLSFYVMPNMYRCARRAELKYMNNYAKANMKEQQKLFPQICNAQVINPKYEEMSRL